MNCSNCDKEIVNHGIKYCSYKCYWDYRRKHPKPKQKCQRCLKLKNIRCIGLCHKCYHLVYEKEMRPKESIIRHRAYNINYNKEHKTSINQTNRDRQRRKFETVRDIKIKSKCVDCGISDWRVLDFDHIRGIKVNGVANLISQRASLKRILDEIEKCEVRCSNCHRIKTIENNGLKHKTNWRN